MALNIMLPVRGVQAVLAITVLGLMAYVASWWTSHWRQFSPAEVNWMIFSPVWTILTLVPLVLVPMKFPHLSTSPAAKYGLLAVEAITMLYWFGGFIALAVFLNDRICFGTVCSVAKAGTALAALQWVAWVVSLAVSVMAVVKGRSSAMGMRSAEPKVEMHQGV